MTREPFRPLFRRFMRCERGDPIVEFILVLPLMLVLGFGVMEIGRILWYQHFITKGVRDGTRYLTRVPLADLGVAADCAPVSSGAADCDKVLAREISATALTYAACLARSGAYWGAIAPANVTVRLCPIDHAGAFYGPDPLHMVRMTAQVPVDFPILNAFLKTGPSVTFTVFNESRHIGQ